MILSHRAPSSLDMSSYRAIWTHFKQISMIFEQINIPNFIYLNSVHAHWLLALGVRQLRWFASSKSLHLFTLL